MFLVSLFLPLPPPFPSWTLLEPGRAAGAQVRKASAPWAALKMSAFLPRVPNLAFLRSVLLFKLLRGDAREASRRGDFYYLFFMTLKPSSAIIPSGSGDQAELLRRLSPLPRQPPAFGGTPNPSPPLRLPRGPSLPAAALPPAGGTGRAAP